MTKLGSSLIALSLLATMATAGTAAANTVAVDGGQATEVRTAREPWGGSQRVEGRIGMLLGGSDVGDADGFAAGISGSLGYRVGDVTLRGLLDYYRIGDGSDEAMDRRGRSTRIGGALRYALISTGTLAGDNGVGAELWGEVGAGWEHAAWRAGGVLDRPTGELAVGFDIDAKGRERSPGRRRHVGYFMAVRAMFGEGPETDTPAVCGGPCSKATKPSRLDTSMFFELGVHWGR